MIFSSVVCFDAIAVQPESEFNNSCPPSEKVHRIKQTVKDKPGDEEERGNRLLP